MHSFRYHFQGLIVVSSLHLVFAVQKIAKEELSVVRVQELSVDRIRKDIAVETKLHLKGLHHKQHDTVQASSRTLSENDREEEVAVGRRHHEPHDTGHARFRMNLVEAITNPNGAITQAVSLGRKRDHLARKGKLHLHDGNHNMHAVEVDPSGDVTDETALLDMAYDSRDDAEQAPVTPPVVPAAVPLAAAVPVVVAPAVAPPVAATPVGAPPAVAAPAVAPPVAASPTVAPPVVSAPTVAPLVASAPVGTPPVAAAPVAGAAIVAQPDESPFIGTVVVLLMFLVVVAVVVLGCWRILVPYTNWRRTSSFPSRFAERHGATSASPRGSPRHSFSPWQSSVPRSPRGQGPDQPSASTGMSAWQSSGPRSPRGKGPDQSSDLPARSASAGFLDPGWQKPHRPYRMKDAPSTEDDERQPETVADGGGGRN